MSFNSMLKEKDKEAYKEQIKTTDSIIKSIEKEQAKYFGTIDNRQGITRNPEVTVTQRLGAARGYIDSRQGPQTGQKVNCSNKRNKLQIQP